MTAAIHSSSTVPMLPDTGPGGGDVVPGVAVEGRRGGLGLAEMPCDEVQLRQQQPQGQTGEAAVFGAQQGQFTAQRFGAVRGDERLVAAVGDR